MKHYKYTFFLLLTLSFLSSSAQQHHVKILNGTNLISSTGTYVDFGEMTNFGGHLELSGTSKFTKIVNNGSLYFMSGSVTNVEGQMLSYNTQSTYIYPNAHVTVDSDLQGTQGELIIKSDASGTGSLITRADVVRSGGIAFKVERYFKTGGVGSDSGTSNWHLISSPVDNEVAGVFKGHFLNYYDEEESTFYSFSSKLENLVKAQGYATKLDFTKDDGISDNSNPIVFSKDVFNAGLIEIELESGQGGTVFNLPANFNLVGNPYPSNLDWDSMWSENLSNVEPTIYYYVDDGSGTNSWTQYNAATSMGGGERYISIGQGFGVVAKPDGAILKFMDNYRTHDGGGDIFSKKNKSRNNYFELEAFSNNYHDKIYFRFNENTTQDFDVDFDAYKINSFGGSPTPYFISNDGKRLSICEMPESESVELGFNMAESGDVTFSVLNVKDISEIILEDKQENTFTNLTKETYTFKYNNDDDEQGRFKIHFSKGTLDNKENTAKDLKVFSNLNKVFINTTQSISNATVNIYNFSGQLIFSKHYPTLKEEVVETSVPSGIYIIEIRSDNNQEFTSKLNLKSN